MAVFQIFILKLEKSKFPDFSEEFGMLYSVLEEKSASCLIPAFISRSKFNVV